MRAISHFLIRLTGWKLDDQSPDVPRYVLIGYPHTSNWDFVIGMLAKSAMSMPLNWVAKHSIFWGPFKYLFVAMGGIPLNRDTTQGFIQKNIEIFQQREHFVLGLMPEGTRSKADHWKSGFYHIAQGAGVPIAFAYMDYSKKIVGVGKVIQPSGDMQADMEIIREFYSDKIGRHPEKQSEICCNTRSDSETKAPDDKSDD